jgi:hypothetical protein
VSLPPENHQCPYQPATRRSWFPFVPRQTIAHPVYPRKSIFSKAMSERVQRCPILPSPASKTLTPTNKSWEDGAADSHLC